MLKRKWSSFFDSQYLFFCCQTSSVSRHAGCFEVKYSGGIVVEKSGNFVCCRLRTLCSCDWKCTRCHRNTRVYECIVVQLEMDVLHVQWFTCSHVYLCSRSAVCTWCIVCQCKFASVRTPLFFISTCWFSVCATTTSNYRKNYVRLYSVLYW